MSGDQYTVAESVTRLIPHFSTDRKMEVPADLPGVVIFLHGVNDPGASYESVETGLCQGVNERLDRPDLKAGRYGAAYAEAKKMPKEDLQDWQVDTLNDPDTYLYQRDTEAPKTRSLMIPFYWGYRAEPGEIKRDKNNDPTKLRDQYQDVFENRLDRHFAKGGGFFANATNNLLEMYREGFNNWMRHGAQLTLKKTQYMGRGPHRRYYVLAATRLAMLISEIRRVSPDETITIMGHSQGTLITLLAQALLIDKAQRCADTVIMVDSPYSLMPGATPKGHDTLATLIGIVTAITGTPHAQPPLSALRETKTYGGRTGPKWSPTQGTRKNKVGNLTVFPERDNRGKVYLYFCPDDTTVALDTVKGIGTFGVPDVVPDFGRPAMMALQFLRFYQRMWTKRERDGEPFTIGKAPQPDFLRAGGEPRYSGDDQFVGVISRTGTAEREERLINGEPLNPLHIPQMFGGEAVPGTRNTAGLDKPDDVAIESALGNPHAQFNRLKIDERTTAFDLEQEASRWNEGKETGDHARMSQVKIPNARMDGSLYILLREETANEIRARLRDKPELEPNSYHSAILRSPENQRWVTAMDIAVGQAHCLDDPVMREVLVAIADWRMDEKLFRAASELPGWSRLSEESQTLVEACSQYYEIGTFPPAELVSLTPPSLVTSPDKKEAGQ
ncbi:MULTISPECIES: DUF3274 domain-containing protein [unclassified Pseudomonas]|nr:MULTISPECIES: DUF3274 domain-containing protein [unclassified Pseudomonas]MBP1126869.1 pimeloyl-ACP methyl ester carboxylesterase [Pseudomonas sp. PvP025]MDQ0400729.1 pimeloyl-ACP methyl ester carboxylesterase [Pseudomonas sp. PvP006]